jgi:hypothetical protein
LARRRGNCLNLLFLGFLGLPITFCHADLLKFDDDAVIECRISQQGCASHAFSAQQACRVYVVTRKFVSRDMRTQKLCSLCHRIAMH